MPTDLPPRPWHRAARPLTDLDAIRAVPAPRVDALVAQLVRRLSPASGFIIPALLYFLMAVNAVVFGVTIATMSILAAVTGQQPLPPWALGIVGLVSMAGFLLAWIPFGLWVRHRRRDLRRVLRDGVLTQGQVVAELPLALGGGRLSALVDFTGDGREHSVRVTALAHHERLERGDVCELLWLDGVPFVIAFPGGDAVIARLPS